MDEEEPDLSLNEAASEGDLETLEKLLENCDQAEKHRRLETKDYLGNTSLRLAATGNADCVRYLLSCGADPHMIDVKAQTPMFVATKNRHTDCMTALLSHGACPDGDNRNVSTPLYMAVMTGCTEGVQLLLDHGADLTFQTRRMLIGQTPLTIGVAYQQYDCVRLLLLAGCDPNRRVAHSIYASLFHACVECRHDRRLVGKEMAELLYEFGTDLYKRHPSTGQYAWEHPADSPAKHFLLSVKDSSGEIWSYFPLIQGYAGWQLPHNDWGPELRSFDLPRSLMSHCRLATRRVLGAARLHCISKLPLPTVLHSYLLYQQL